MNNQFSENTLSKMPDSYFVQLAQSFYEKHGRIPNTKELGFSNARIIFRRFKTWKNFIQNALGKTPAFARWSDEELLKWLADLYKELNRFPVHTEVSKRSTSVAKLIYLRFGDLHNAMEKAVGTSVRKEILLALKRLTPPGCQEASTQEIFHELQASNINTSKQVVANTLDYLKRGLHLAGVRRGETNLWTLTQKGKELIKTFN